MIWIIFFTLFAIWGFSMIFISTLGNSVHILLIAAMALIPLRLIQWFFDAFAEIGRLLKITF